MLVFEESKGGTIGFFDEDGYEGGYLSVRCGSGWEIEHLDAEYALDQGEVQQIADKLKELNSGTVTGKTDRGFSLVEFTDKYGNPCSVQKSSLATDDCLWLGIEDANPQIMASQAAELGVETKETTGWVTYPVPDEVHMTTRMHLNREQVAALIPILQRFVDTGDF